jgi:outer membrane protein assembly complex protein YaeT
LAVALSGVTPVAGQTYVEPILRIEFDPPRQPLPQEELLNRIALKPGEPATRDAVQRSIQELYNTGRFTDIQVESRPEPGGVVVIFHTEQAFFIGRVVVRGAKDPPNSGQLASATKLQLGTPYLSYDLPQAEENMQERLRRNGFYHADIEHEVTKVNETGEVEIDFRIKPGRRARFGGVVLEGGPTISLEKLESVSGWRRGIPWFNSRLFGWRDATEERLTSGIERILKRLQRGNRLLASVRLDRLEYDANKNAVIPHLRIREGPNIEVTLAGAKLSKGKLRNLLPIYAEQSVDRSLLVEGRRNLEEYFRSQGYFSAAVNYRRESESPEMQKIVYTVDRGDRSKLGEITIEGNKYFTDQTLEERLAMRPASFVRFRYGRFSNAILDRDLNAIRDLYRSNGFKDAKVTADVKDNAGGKQNRIGVAINIEEGPQSFVNSLKIQGISKEDMAKLEPQLQSSEGQPFSELNIATDRDTILSYYFVQGYTEANFDWTQEPGPSPNLFNLQYRVVPGTQQFVRSVLIDGLEVTDPNLVNRRIPLGPGEPVSLGRIAESQKRLYDLGIFAKVQVGLQNPEGDENRKYLIYQFEEARKYSVNFGLGAELGRIGGGTTTLDSPAGAAGFSPRVSLGVSRLNMFGVGHTASIQGRVSRYQRRAFTTYLAPQFKGNENYSVSLTGLFDDSQDVRTFQSRRWEGSLQFAQRISRSTQFQYRYTFRRATVSDVKIDPGLIPLLAQPVRVGGVSVSFIQDRRDDPLEPTKGTYNTVDVGNANSWLGSETEYLRLQLRNATYHRIGREKVFARSTQFGYIQRLGGLPEIPLSERLYGGGVFTHRGFPDNQAGPRDLVTGFPLGGTMSFFNTVEYRFPFVGENLNLVLFHDMGNVYSDISKFSFRFRQRDLQDFDYMVQAAGIGIRYRTPLGPIRVDFAFSPNSPRFYGYKGSYQDLVEGKGEQVNQRINKFQFHFSIGNTF